MSILIKLSLLLSLVVSPLSIFADDDCDENCENLYTSTSSVLPGVITSAGGGILTTSVGVSAALTISVPTFLVYYTGAYVYINHFFDTTDEPDIARLSPSLQDRLSALTQVVSQDRNIVEYALTGIPRNNDFERIYHINSSERSQFAKILREASVRSSYSALLDSGSEKDFMAFNNALVDRIISSKKMKKTSQRYIEEISKMSIKL